MNQAFDPLNLLILAVAVVIFLRLRSVLGKRTGSERPTRGVAPRLRLWWQHGACRLNVAAHREHGGQVFTDPVPCGRLVGEAVWDMAMSYITASAPSRKR